MAKRTQNKDENTTTIEQNSLIAKKDWRILSGNYNRAKGTHDVDIQVSKGQDVGKLKLDEKFLAVLRTENVI